MRRTGVRGASRNDPKEDADEPAGRDVLPGTYKLVMQYQGVQDSTMITVHRDPRLKLTDEMLLERDVALAEFESVVETAANAFNQLKNAKKTIELIDKAIVNIPDSTQKEVRKKGKEITKKVNELMELYMLPEDTKGYAYDENKIQSIIGEANNYLSNSAGNPGENASLASNYAYQKLKDALDKINSFVEGDWTKYVEAMKNVEFDLFSEVKKTMMNE
jgi:hypothetical protein